MARHETALINLRSVCLYQNAAYFSFNFAKFG